MVIHIKRIRAVLCAAGLSVLFPVIFFNIVNSPSIRLKMGAFICPDGQNQSERYLRPSRQPALELKYTFSLPAKGAGRTPAVPEGYPEVYQNPGDVIHAYYSILKAAGGIPEGSEDRMPGKFGQKAYLYAYELLSPGTKKEVSPEEFIMSFAGTEHITLLKLDLTQQPSGNPPNVKYYFVEIETITGAASGERLAGGSLPDCFTYFYGLIITEKAERHGWTIKSIEYFPEEFLTARNALKDSRALVESLHKEKYGLVESIAKLEKRDFNVFVYAGSKEKEYRFDFVRLTNGEDILLREYIKDGSRWKEADLLRGSDRIYKFSPLNPRLHKK